MKMAYFIDDFKVLNDVNDPSKGWIIKYKIVKVDSSSVFFGTLGIIIILGNNSYGFNSFDIVTNIVLSLCLFSLILMGLFSDNAVDKVFDSKEEAKEYRKKLFDIKFNA